MSSNILSLDEFKLTSSNLRDKTSEEFNEWISRRKSSFRNIETFLKERSYKTDELISSVWKYHGLSNKEDLGIFAVGGYGRQELHPFSDIDLLILHKGRLNKENKNKVEKFIGTLWDLNLDIGHSVRSDKEEKNIAKCDLQAFTNLLESRFLAGDLSLKKITNEIINSKDIWNKEKFLIAKLDEQTERHNRFDNTEYNLEPNIKSSPGGLRDIHILEWLILNYSRKGLKLGNYKKIFSEEDKKELNKSKLLLWTLRFLLHEEANREEDRLLLNYQTEIAKKLFPKISKIDAAAEKLMHRYFRSALSISEINSSVIQGFKENLIKPKKSKLVLKDKDFVLKDNLIHLRSNKSFKRDTSLILKIFVTLCKNPKIKGIHSQTQKKLKESKVLINSSFRKEKKNIDLFMELLRSKRLMVTQLEQMKLLGILGKYLPEFGRVTGQMQYDLFHIYTVDAHTLQVLRNMRRLLLGTSKNTYPLASDLIKKIPKLELLYIAGLYHDIGKGRGKDHSGLGTKIAKRFCVRHMLSNKDSELVSWLVKNHLKMSITSQKEDLTEASVIENFSDLIRTEERLNYLYCLTVADISATNPNLWNSWNETLLNDLYFKTLNSLNSMEEISRYSKKEVEKLLPSIQQKHRSKFKDLWENFYPNYFQDHSPQLILEHSQQITEISPKTVVKFLSKKSSSEAQSLLVYTYDRRNVFSTIIGELDANNINVLDAKLYGTKNGYCLDHIIVSDNKGGLLDLSKEKKDRVEKTISSSLDKDVLQPKFVQRRIPIYFQTLRKGTQIKIKHDMSNRWTQLDIKTADRPGLLSTICKVFTQNDASIKKARIATYGERAEDRFCICSPEETPFLKKQKLEKLIQELKGSLDKKI